jgi:hypothetical protein
MIDLVTSMCTRNEIKVWKYSSKYIIKNIDAKKFQVVVPAEDLNIFKEVTPSSIEVIDENSILKELNFNKIKELLPGRLKFMTGWYFQQFLKLQSIANLPSGSLGLIWDSDTIPLKKLSFVNPNGSLNFYTSNEDHRDYFTANKNILGIEKLNSKSFISQCAPFYADHMVSLLGEIESKHGVIWFESIISCLEGDSVNLFSEYELIGNYLLSRHNELVNLNPHPWERNGRNIIKSESNFNEIFLKKLALKYDFIAIEKWLDPTISDYWHRRGKNLFKRIIGKC